MQLHSFEGFLSEEPVVVFDCPFLYDTFLEAQGIAGTIPVAFLNNLYIGNLVRMLHLKDEKTAIFRQRQYVTVMMSSALHGSSLDGAVVA